MSTSTERMRRLREGRRVGLGGRPAPMAAIRAPGQAAPPYSECQGPFRNWPKVDGSGGEQEWLPVVLMGAIPNKSFAMAWNRSTSAAIAAFPSSVSESSSKDGDLGDRDGPVVARVGPGGPILGQLKIAVDLGGPPAQHPCRCGPRAGWPWPDRTPCADPSGSGPGSSLTSAAWASDIRASFGGSSGRGVRGSKACSASTGLIKLPGADLAISGGVLVGGHRCQPGDLARGVAAEGSSR